MPSPKSGTQVDLVSPTEPDDAIDASKDEPGTVESVDATQRTIDSGSYGSQQITAHKNSNCSSDDQDDSEKKKSWIEVQLVTEAGDPVPGAHYRVEMSDGSVWDSSLDEKGVGRVDNIDPGTCKISFPDLDKDAWDDA